MEKKSNISNNENTWFDRLVEMRAGYVLAKSVSQSKTHAIMLTVGLVSFGLFALFLVKMAN